MQFFYSPERYEILAGRLSSHGCFRWLGKDEDAGRRPGKRRGGPVRIDKGAENRSDAHGGDALELDEREGRQKGFIDAVRRCGCGSADQPALNVDLEGQPTVNPEDSAEASSFTVD